MTDGETIRGPVESAITQLMQHMEVSMWARGVDPLVSTEVLNLMMFGHPHGSSNGGQVTNIPAWAEEMAGHLEATVRRSLMVQPHDTELDVAAETKMVVLALVRKVLLGRPDTFDQALAPQKS